MLRLAGLVGIPSNYCWIADPRPGTTRQVSIAWDLYVRAGNEGLLHCLVVRGRKGTLGRWILEELELIRSVFSPPHLHSTADAGGGGSWFRILCTLEKVAPRWSSFHCGLLFCIDIRRQARDMKY